MRKIRRREQLPLQTQNLQSSSIPSSLTVILRKLERNRRHAWRTTGNGKPVRYGAGEHRRKIQTESHKRGI